MITAWILVFTLQYGTETYSRINTPYKSEAICRTEAEKVIAKMPIAVDTWDCKPVLQEKKK